MSQIDEFNQEYNKHYDTNQKLTEWVLSDFINNAFAAIDCELSELQNNVDSGQYSNQDIFDQIQEIREIHRRKKEHKLTKEEYLKMYKEDKLAELCEQFEEERDYYHNEMLAYKSDAQSAQKKLEELSSYWESMDKLSKKLETLPAKDFIKLYYIMHGLINNHVRYSNTNVRAIEPDSLSSLRSVTTAYN